jgi:hypothetical protein
LTSGILFDSGGGSCGFAPLPASMGCWLGAPAQEARSVTMASATTVLLALLIVDLHSRITQ